MDGRKGDQTEADKGGKYWSASRHYEDRDRTTVFIITAPEFKTEENND